MILHSGEPETAIREVFDCVDGLHALAIDTPDRAAARSAPATPRAPVRVDLERFDRLVNPAMLTRAVEAAGLTSNTPVRTGLEDFLHLAHDIQQSVMMNPAQPVKSLFRRMSRILREASATIGTDVRMTVDGDHTEVDRTVIERLADPLTHMIRNAVEHGPETGELRTAAGTSRQGKPTPSARHRSARVIIGVSDDGAGIDRAKVFWKAVESGLLPAEPHLTLVELVIPSDSLSHRWAVSRTVVPWVGFA